MTGTSQNINQAQPPEVVVSAYEQTYRDTIWTYVNWCSWGPVLNDADTANWTWAAGGIDQGYVIASANPCDNNPGENDFYDDALAGGEGGYGAAWVNGVFLTSRGQVAEAINTRVMIEPSGRALAGATTTYLVQARAWDYDGLVTGEPLAADAMQIDGVTLTDEGNGWGYMLLTAPAGATPEVTPTAPESTFQVQAAPLNLQIMDANSGADLTAQTNTVIVGQQMNWYCQLNVTNALLNNGMLTNFQWTVPGDAISNYVADASSGIVYTNFSLNNSNVVFYWVDGANNRTIQCSATIDGKTVTGQATFDVLRPTEQITTSTGTVALDNNYPYFALHYGNPNAIPGIIFTNTITIPSGFSGETEWVQKITSTLRRYELANTNIWYRSQASNVLDTIYPYPNDISTNASSDSPGLGVDSSMQAVSVSDNFERWLLFKPDGGQWVPLRKASWNWGGTGTWNGTNWNLASPTNQVGSDQDSTDYPQWNDNIVNHETFQQE